MVESNALAELLRLLRRRNGWTQDDLGARLGVTRCQISNIEAGRSDMPASKLLELLAADGGWGALGSRGKNGSPG